MATTRLPTTLRPLHYDLVVRTDLHPDQLSFDGLVKIELDVLETTSMIVLNASPSLTLGAASVVSTSIEHEPEQHDAYRSYDTSLERVTFHFAKFLEAGRKVILHIGFSGKLRSTMNGLYYSTCIIDGKPVHYSATMFEPLNARAVFPCWDEPALKSTFSISLISRSHLVNVSNMPILYEGPLDTVLAGYLCIPAREVESGWKITRFAKTPLMASYLAAWGTGPFEYRQRSYKSPISGMTRPLRIYATPEVIGQAEHALNVNAKVLYEYEKMFDVEFPLPKLDTLLTREATGAMENWGLIIASAAAYIVDPKRSDISKLITVGSIQSHETGHQWFGNITTMKVEQPVLERRADLIDLQAGDFALGRVWPEYQMETRFVSHVLDTALNLDAKLSSHPIEADIPDEGKIAQVFDALSYQKAASVFRMFAAHVGIDVFLKGLSVYLKQHLYGSTTSQDLWRALSEVAGFDVGDMLKEWMGETGFPAIIVDDVGTGVRVRQTRFWERGRLDAEHDKVIWNVPLSTITKNNHGTSIIDRSHILSKREAMLDLDTSRPFKLNVGTTGVYRVLYTGNLFDGVMREAVKVGSIFAAEDRVGLLLDTLAFAKAGLAKTSGVLALANALRHDRDFFVLEGIASSLDVMRLLWRDNVNIVVGLKLLQQSIFAPIVERLGYEVKRHEAPLDDLLRQVAVKQAASGGEPSVVAELTKSFERAQETGNEKHISPGLVGTVYTTAVLYGGRKSFHAMKDILENSQDPNVRNRCLTALGACSNVNLVENMFRSLYGTISIPEMMVVLGSLSAHGQGRFVSQFLKVHIDEIVKSVPMAVSRFVVMAFGSFNTAKVYEQSKAYFNGKDTSTYDLGLSQALEQIQGNIHWLQHGTSDVAQWLAEWQTHNV